MNLTCIAEESGNLYTSTHGFRELRLPKGYRLNISERIDSATVEEWHEPWSGEGLPPVGTMCEFLAMTDKSPSWEAGEILYISLYTVVISGDGFEHVAHPSNLNFRPIRTPEQIAEDDRAREVREMANVLRGHVPQSVKAAFALYDAGYRKQEQP